MCIITDTGRQTYTQTRIHAHTLTNKQTHIHLYTHTHTHTHTHLNIGSLTRTHTNQGFFQGGVGGAFAPPWLWLVPSWEFCFKCESIQVF